MRIRALAAVAVALTVVVVSAAPANAGWLVHSDQASVGGRVLRAEAEDFFRWGPVHNGFRRWATLTVGKGRAAAHPAVDHLCLRSTFVANGPNIEVRTEADFAHITRGDRWVAVSFRSCGSGVAAIQASYPRIAFVGDRVHRVDHLLRVEATNTSPAYAGTFTIRRSQHATNIGGDPPPIEMCEA